MGCEAGEAGQLAGVDRVDRVDPGREPGTQTVTEYLAEVTDMPGGRIQFGAAGQDILQAGLVLLGQSRRMSGEPALPPAAPLAALAVRRTEPRARWRCGHGPCRR